MLLTRRAREKFCRGKNFNERVVAIFLHLAVAASAVVVVAVGVGGVVVVVVVAVGYLLLKVGVISSLASFIFLLKELQNVLLLFLHFSQKRTQISATAETVAFQKAFYC